MLVESKKFNSASAFEAALTHREKASWIEKQRRRTGGSTWDPSPPLPPPQYLFILDKGAKEN